MTGWIVDKDQGEWIEYFYIGMVTSCNRAIGYISSLACVVVVLEVGWVILLRSSF